MKFYRRKLSRYFTENSAAKLFLLYTLIQGHFRQTTEYSVLLPKFMLLYRKKPFFFKYFFYFILQGQLSINAISSMPHGIEIDLLSIFRKTQVNSKHSVILYNNKLNTTFNEFATKEFRVYRTPLDETVFKLHVDLFK